MADLSVASCIRPLQFAGGLTVKRRPQPVYVKGVMVENPPTLLSIVGHLQPAQPRTLMFLPEGERMKDYVWVYSETQLQIADAQKMQLSDRVTYSGRDYEVAQLFDRTPNDSFYKALCVRVGQ